MKLRTLAIKSYVSGSGRGCHNDGVHVRSADHGLVGVMVLP
jgi:hypothetical protein